MQWYALNWVQHWKIPFPFNPIISGECSDKFWTLRKIRKKNCSVSKLFSRLDVSKNIPNFNQYIYVKMLHSFIGLISVQKLEAKIILTPETNRNHRISTKTTLPYHTRDTRQRQNNSPKCVKVYFLSSDYSAFFILILHYYHKWEFFWLNCGICIKMIIAV